VKAGSVFAPKAGMTFYAVWKYTVSFNANGHGGAAAPAPQQIYNGLKMVLPRMADYGGYTFKGWCVGAPTCGSLAADPYPVSGNVTMYAQWTTTYATSLTLSQPALSLRVGSSGTITASLLPSGVSNNSVTWKTSDDRVATVNWAGTGLTATIIAKAPGCITVTATSGDGKQSKEAYVGVWDPNSSTPTLDSMICGEQVTFDGSQVVVTFVALKSLDQNPLEVGVSNVTADISSISLDSKRETGAVGRHTVTLKPAWIPAIGISVGWGPYSAPEFHNRYFQTTTPATVTDGQPLPQEYSSTVVTKGTYFAIGVGIGFVVAAAVTVGTAGADLPVLAIVVISGAAGAGTSVVWNILNDPNKYGQCDIPSDSKWQIQFSSTVTPHGIDVRIATLRYEAAGYQECHTNYTVTFA